MRGLDEGMNGVLSWRQPPSDVGGASAGVKGSGMVEGNGLGEIRFVPSLPVSN